MVLHCITKNIAQTWVWNTICGLPVLFIWNLEDHMDGAVSTVMRLGNRVVRGTDLGSIPESIPGCILSGLLQMLISEIAASRV